MPSSAQDMGHISNGCPCMVARHHKQQRSHQSGSLREFETIFTFSPSSFGTLLLRACCVPLSFVTLKLPIKSPQLRPELDLIARHGEKKGGGLQAPPPGTLSKAKLPLSRNKLHQKRVIWDVGEDSSREHQANICKAGWGWVDWKMFSLLVRPGGYVSVLHLCGCKFTQRNSSGMHIGGSHGNARSCRVESLTWGRNG